MIRYTLLYFLITSFYCNFLLGNNLLTANTDSTILVISPNGGEAFTSGSNHQIKWFSQLNTKLKIEYSINNGLTWFYINSVNSKDSVYLWKIPNSNSMNCLIRLSDSTNPSQYDMSDSLFSISSNFESEWGQANSFTNQSLNACSIVDSNVIWAVGGRGNVLKTTDGGKNWFKKNLLFDEDIYLVLALSAQKCLVSTTPSATKIYKTEDGGNNWTVVYVQNNGFINNLHFFDNNNGYAIGDPVSGKWTLIKTTDGGNSWFNASSLTANINEAGKINSAAWYNDIGFFGTNRNIVYKTTNRGINWSPISTIDTSIFSIFLNSESNGLFGFNQGILNHTYNGGGIFQRKKINTNAILSSITGLFEFYYWITAGNKIYFSNDNANTFNQSYELPNINFNFINQKKFPTYILNCAVGTGGVIAISKFPLSNFPQKKIKILNPTKNNLFISKRDLSIEWNSINISKVKIEFSSNNGVSYNLIDSIDNLGKYSWKIPNSFSNRCKIKISDLTNLNISDSSLTFQIIPDTTSGWINEITLKNSYNDFNKLFFGQLKNATNGIDSIYSEEKDSNFIFNENLKTKFLLPINPLRYSNIDIRNDTIKYAKWIFKIKNTSGYNPIYLNWSPKYFPKNYGLFIYDSLNAASTKKNMHLDSTMLINQDSCILVIEKVELLPKWKVNLTISDNAGLDNQGILTFGQGTFATDSIDNLYNEAKIEQAPVAGNFDIRFTLPKTQNLWSLIDIRNELKQSAEFVFSFQPGSAGYPIKIKWDINSLPKDTLYIKDTINGTTINVNMQRDSQLVINSNSIKQLKIIFRKKHCEEIIVNAGWNLISIPDSVINNKKDSIFPNSSSYAFEYNKGYVISDSLKTGRGYWLKFSTTNYYTICGYQSLNRSVKLDSGWNLIGTFDGTIATNQVRYEPENILASNIFSYSSGYNIATNFDQGKGYWLKTNKSGKIILPDLFLKTNVQTEFKFQNPKIIITDNHLNKVELLFTENKYELIRSELPPSPPIGIFDARFSDNSFIANLNSPLPLLMINTDSYPIKIESKGIDINLSDNINGDFFNQNINDGESIIINNQNINTFKLGKVTLTKPKEFYLSQNYPNPFNPTTTINYEIPTSPSIPLLQGEGLRERSVSLKIYDILGRVVETLVNEPQNSGKYSVQWNASKYSSGIYYYELVAGDFRSIKKMILMK